MIGDEVELGGCVVIGVIYWGLTTFCRSVKAFFVQSRVTRYQWEEWAERRCRRYAPALRGMDVVRFDVLSSRTEFDSS